MLAEDLYALCIICNAKKKQVSKNQRYEIRVVPVGETMAYAYTEICDEGLSLHPDLTLISSRKRMVEDIATAVLYLQMCVPEPSNNQHVIIHQQTKPNLMHKHKWKMGKW